MQGLPTSSLIEKEENIVHFYIIRSYFLDLLFNKIEQTVLN